jgi:hypothetical protein
MEGMYEKAISAIIELDVKNIFEQRSRKIVTDTSGIGWGFHDTLSEIFQNL